MVEKRGCCLNEHNQIPAFPLRRGKRRPWRDDGGGEIVRFFASSQLRGTALATLIHQRRLTPSCGGLALTAERTVGPARMFVESLTPDPGIREQNRSTFDILAMSAIGPLHPR